MMAILVAVVAVMGIALLVLLYLSLLGSLFPEHIRTNEVYRVRTNDLWTLRVCRYRKSRAAKEPVLLVHGMGANQHNFTSPENGCLVDYLCDRDYDCWTVDLRGCKSSQPPFERSQFDVRMEDYFTEDLPAVIDHILKVTDYAKLHWVGHSMGGMLLYAYAQYAGSDRIASGITLGSPIDFSDADGNVPAWLISFGQKFPAMAGNLIRGAAPLAKLLGGGIQAFPINHNNIPTTMHSGHFINMLEDPLPKLMEQVKKWMTDHEYTLLNGTLDVPAGLPDLSVPLLAFFAAEDPFINAERALACFEGIKLDDKKAVLCAKANGFVEDYNHCDLAFSKEADKEIFAPIVQWLKDHSCPRSDGSKTRENAVSATLLSPEKRADILSGAAFTRLTNVDEQTDDAASVTAATEDIDPKAEEKGKATLRSDAVETQGTDKPTAKKKTPAKKTTAAKKKPAAKKKTVAKKVSAKKKPAEKKTTTTQKKAAKKPAAKKKAATKNSTVKEETDNAGDGEEKVSKENQERAERLRNKRNASFSDIMTTLSEPEQTDDKQA